nr:Hypothetical protein [Raoultella ornithinolytica]
MCIKRLLFQRFGKTGFALRHFLMPTAITKFSCFKMTF